MSPSDLLPALLAMATCLPAQSKQDQREPQSDPSRSEQPVPDTPPVDGGGSPVPEPGTLLLVGTGLVGVAFTARRARKTNPDT